jgi:hypothetical protein
MASWSFSVSAQNFISSHAGPRGAALGGTGVVFTDTGSPISNQAGLAFASRFSAAAYVQQPFLVPDISSLSATAVIPIKQGGAGFSIQHLGLKAYREQRIGLAYGRLLAPNTALGLQINAHITTIPEYGHTFTPNMDIGMQTQLFPKTRFGFHLSNPFRTFGRLRQWLPTSVKTGIHHQASEKVSYMVELVKELDFPISLKAGVEYQPSTHIHIRFGASSYPGTASVGLGFALPEGLQLDMSTTYHPSLGISPAFGITYTNKAKS